MLPSARAPRSRDGDQVRHRTGRWMRFGAPPLASTRVGGGPTGSASRGRSCRLPTTSTTDLSPIDDIDTQVKSAMGDPKGAFLSANTDTGRGHVGDGRHEARGPMRDPHSARVVPSTDEGSPRRAENASPSDQPFYTFAPADGEGVCDRSAARPATRGDRSGQRNTPMYDGRPLVTESLDDELDTKPCHPRRARRRSGTGVLQRQSSKGIGPGFGRAAPG